MPDSTNPQIPDTAAEAVRQAREGLQPPDCPAIPAVAFANCNDINTGQIGGLKDLSIVIMLLIEKSATGVLHPLQLSAAAEDILRVLTMLTRKAVARLQQAVDDPGGESVDPELRQCSPEALAMMLQQGRDKLQPIEAAHSLLHRVNVDGISDLMTAAVIERIKREGAAALFDMLANPIEVEPISEQLANSIGLDREQLMDYVKRSSQ